MSARSVKQKLQTKKRRSITSSRWSTCPVDIRDGMCIHDASCVMSAGSKYCAYFAMQPKQEQKIPLEKNKERGVGLKADSEKPMLAYIPKAALYAEGEAFAYGAKKYESWNYKHGISITRTLSAAMRHIVQFLGGEDKDSESGVHHLGCARANLAMALDTLANHPELDDRFKGDKK